MAGEEERSVCPDCGSVRIRRNGGGYNSCGTAAAYRCRSCGAAFDRPDVDDVPRVRPNSNTLAGALLGAGEGDLRAGGDA